MALNDKIKQYAAGATLAAATALPAHGASITQMQPNKIPGETLLGATITNDNAGAVYNSVELPYLNALAQDLVSYAHNSSTYGGSAQNLIGDWGLNVSSTGDVSQGWDFDINNPVSIQNDGIAPGTTYDIWDSGLDMDFIIAIPDSQLDANGNGFLGDPGDLELTLSNDTMTNGVVGKSASGFTEWPADPQTYTVNTVVPSPSSGALAALGIAALAAGYRGRNPSHTK
jgi:hypothetical protein